MTALDWLAAHWAAVALGVALGLVALWFLFGRRTLALFAAALVRVYFERFVADVEQALAARGVTLAWRSGATALIVERTRGIEVACDLTDAFLAFTRERRTGRSAAPEARWIADVAALLAAPGPASGRWSACAPNLVPIVLPAVAAAALCEAIGREDARPLLRPVGPGLRAGCLLRDSGVPRLVTAGMARAWGRSPEDVHAAALAGLRAATARRETRWVEAQGVLVLRSSDGLDGARALLAHEMLPGGGSGHLIAIPDAFSLLATAGTDRHARRRLARMAERHRLLSPLPLPAGVYTPAAPRASAHDASGEPLAAA